MISRRAALAAACAACVVTTSVTRSVTAFAPAAEPLPAALQAMADTEREFARTAKVKGIRDSFLEFFADDAIAFTPEVTAAKKRLLAQKPTPFAVNELLWEPRAGDVAASGEIGWLTGPSTFTDHSGADARPHYGNYLSVWRTQADGRWRVFIDVGVGLEAEAAFAPGFTRTPFGPRYSGKEGKEAAGRSLLEADRALNGRLASDGARRAYAAILTPDTRLHRPGFAPVIGAPAIESWLDLNATGLSASSTAAESSVAGDLGYSYGKYEETSAKPQTGAYVRIWTRDAAGRWFVVADVTQPVGPRR
jgi:ketosteroid isomerase-like protein